MNFFKQLERMADLLLRDLLRQVHDIAQGLKSLDMPPVKPRVLAHCSLCSTRLRFQLAALLWKSTVGNSRLTSNSEFDVLLRTT